jgi:hypothetical protein
VIEEYLIQPQLITVQIKPKEGKINVAGATTPTIHQLATWAMSNSAAKVPAMLRFRRACGDRANPVNKMTDVDSKRLVGTKKAQIATQ